MKYPEEIYLERVKELEVENALLKAGVEAYKGRVQRLEKLHTDIITYQSTRGGTGQ